MSGVSKHVLSETVDLMLGSAESWREEVSRDAPLTSDRNQSALAVDFGDLHDELRRQNDTGPNGKQDQRSTMPDSRSAGLARTRTGGGGGGGGGGGTGGLGGEGEAAAIGAGWPMCDGGG